MKPGTMEHLDLIFARTEDDLSDAELEGVAALLRETTDLGLQHRCIHILGWAHAREHAPLIASFLGRTDGDLTVPAIALRALVRCFSNAKPYTDVVKRFLTGIPEDDDLSLQFDTLQIAGEAYRQTLDPEILRCIVSFCEGDEEMFRRHAEFFKQAELYREEVKEYRDQARESLVTALAPEWETLTPKQRLDLRDAFDTVDYLGQARERLA